MEACCHMSGNSEQITEVEIMSFVFCFRIPIERIPQSDMIGQTKTRPNLKTKTMEILMNHAEVFIQTLGHYSRISHINMGIATHAAEKTGREATDTCTERHTVQVSRRIEGCFPRHGNKVPGNVRMITAFHMETYTICATSGYGAEFHINAIGDVVRCRRGVLSTARQEDKA